MKVLVPVDGSENSIRARNTLRVLKNVKVPVTIVK